MTETKPNEVESPDDRDVGVHCIVRQRFQDQIDADGAAEEFLLSQFHRFDASTLSMEWFNFEGSEGRMVAIANVIRDEMNWSEFCGTLLV